MHRNLAMSKFSYNKYVHDERRNCTKTNVFHPPPLETKDYLTVSYIMPTMPKKALIEENESLKTFLELSEASINHFKRDRDCLRVELEKFKDRNVKQDFEVSYPSVCRARIHDLPFREFEDIPGNSKLMFNQNKQDKESLNLHNSLLERLTHQQKTITTQTQELHKLKNEIKKRDTKLQGVQEELRKKESKLATIKDDLQLTSKHLSEIKNRSQEEPQYRIILKLEHDIKLQEQEIKRLQKSLERKTTEASECKSLRSSLQETKNQLSDLRNENKQNLQKLKQALVEVDETKKERNSDRLTKFSQERQIQQLQKEIEQFHFMTDHQTEFSKKSKMKDSEKYEMDKELGQKVTLVNSLKGQLQEANRKLAEKEIELREMKSRHTEQFLQKQQKHRLEKDIEQLHLKANSQETFSKMKDNKTFEKEEESKKRDVQITSLTNQLQQAKRKLMETESELREMKTTHTKQVHDLEKQIEQLHFTANRQKAVSKLKDSERFQTDEDVKKRDLQITSLTDQLQQAKRKLTETESELRETNTKHTKQVHSLKKEIEQLHVKANRLEEVSKTSKIENSERLELDKELRKRENQITVLNDNLQQIKGKLRETESELREMKTRRTDHSLQKQVQRLEKEIEELRLKAYRREAVSETSKMEESERIKMEEELKKREVQIASLTDQLQQEKRKLMEKESELQETKTRLSKAMGDRLTDNNPNIADLSDKNRPVKLAERFGELYDNQWTDAYDIIQKYFDTEERTLGELLNILQDIFCFCKTSWARQMEGLLKALWFSANSEDAPTEVSKILKDCKKTTASVAMRNLYEMYISQLQHSGGEKSRIALEIRPFVKECLEICWLMMIQDPPVVFAPTAERGSKLNTDIFKPYTKSGTHVEYTVWPAMLLHEGGPVLAKGVAQGYKKE